MATEESEACIMCCFRQSLLQCHYLLYLKMFYVIVLFWTVILCQVLHEQRKNQDLICCDITDLGLCLHRARKFPSAANLSVHSTHSAQHTQLKCSSSLPVGLRWHLWGAISISVAPPGDPPKVHHRCSEVYAASSTYRHMATLAGH